MQVNELELPGDYLDRLPRSFRPWAEQLPHQLASYLDRWDLTVTGALPLSYSYVAPVERSDGRSCVLKIQPTGIPEAEGAERELLGLRLGSPLTVAVVEEDAKNGALLLERADPGRTLEHRSELDDDAATETMASIIRDYGRPVEEPRAIGLRPIAELAEAFERFDERRNVLTGGSLVAVGKARETAEALLVDLLSDSPQPVLLHGDLHHGNVLEDAHRGLLVIDPWGLYGERSADVAPALHNPLAFVEREPDVGSLVRRRVSIYEEMLEVPRDRLIAWCYVYNAIRLLWGLEDQKAVPEHHACLRTLDVLQDLI